MANRYNLKIKVGSYTGDGTSNRNIDIGMPVKYLAVKRRIGTGNGTWSMRDLPLTFAASFGSGPESNSGIQRVTESGFTVSNFSAVNAAGSEYDYFAIGGDSTTIGTGSYMGTGVNPTTITDSSINFTPGWLFVKAAAATTSRYRTSLMSDSGSFTTATNAASNILSLISGGFTIGGSANVNTSGAVHRFVALNTHPSYYYETTFTGNGTSQTITGLPFNPDFIFAKCDSTTNAVGLWFSTNPTETQYITSTAPVTDGITAATDYTLTIGANTLTNEDTKTVRLMCFKAGEYVLPFNRTAI